MQQLDLFPSQPDSPSKNFTIYRSSAGSGKTFTLVKEYLKLILRNPSDYQHILAITFTNKATEQMKFRIIRRLQEMAAGGGGIMREVLEQEFSHFPDRLDIPTRASKALNLILHNYSRFSISTIDHFFSKLVRSLARELHLNLNYEIDVDDETAMRESLQNLYDELHEHPEAQEWIKNFAFSRIDQDKGWQLDYNLVEFGMELFKEKFHQAFTKIDPQVVNLPALKELEEQLENTISNYQKQQQQYAIQALELLRNHQLTKADFKYKGSGSVSTFEKFMRKDFRLTKRFIQVVQGEDDWHGKGIRAEEVRLLAETRLQTIAMELYVYHQKHYSSYLSAIELRKNIYGYGLLEALNQQLRKYRQQNNLMLLSHNSFLLREIIADQDAPFLFEKLGGYYHHLLIDEFQDTSTYQWKNLRPLVTHSLDNHNHVLLVGDAKQSIYRWRGGDLHLLLHQVEEDLHLYRQQLEEKELRDNYRSAKNIVAFNNQFFEVAHKLLLNTRGLPENSGMITEVYQQVQQNVTTKRNGSVEIRFVERAVNAWWEAVEQMLVDLIISYRNEGGNYRDILILLSKNEEVNQVSELLNRHAIPAISDQALQLADHWAVRLVISAMYLMNDPGDTLARAEMAYLYQREICHRKSDYHQIFTEAVAEDRGPVANLLPEKLMEQWPSLQGFSCFEWLCEFINLIFDGQPDPYLQRLLELCLDQGKKGKTAIVDFLRWWEDNKHQQMVISPSAQDALQVMTIHKSKGLEAPVVIIPKADFELKPRNDSIFWTDHLADQYQRYQLLPLNFNEQLLDSHFAEAYQQELMEGLIEGLNTAYVAFTRASQQLHVFSPSPTKEYALEELGYLHRLAWKVCTLPQWGDAWNEQTRSLKISDINEAILSTEPLYQESQAINELKINSNLQRVNVRPESHFFFLLQDHPAGTRINEGIQLHRILEELEHKDQLIEVLTRLQWEGFITKEQLPKIKYKIEGLFTKSLFSSWFDGSWTVRSEREIYFKGNAYKPDRVLSREDKTVIIDFKRKQPDSSHKVQINQYADLLEFMGYRNIHRYLVYTEDSAIMEVDG